MTTITEKLAEALRVLADCREPFDPDKPGDWNPEAYRNARTTLAEYEDLGRPLEVGDRVRVVAAHKFTGTYPSPGFGIGGELVVVQKGTGDLLRCAAEGELNYLLNFAPYELERIA